VLISIIIPAFNEQLLLPHTLRRIQSASQSFLDLAWQFECIVCDNNSTDHTAEMAHAQGARVIFEPVNQISRARNTGASIARGDWLLFIDADSQPSPELFADVARHIMSGQILGGGATIQLDDPHRIGNLLTAAWNRVSRTLRWMAGSFIFVETAAFHAAGRFNQELFAAEEIDLSRRLKKLARASGKKLVILHRAPLLTSARKMRLYSLPQLAQLLLFPVLNPSRLLKKPSPYWYDGRRE
jgi:GT2 family glycosyltransferase